MGLEEFNIWVCSAIFQENHYRMFANVQSFNTLLRSFMMSFVRTQLYFMFSPQDGSDYAHRLSLG